MRVSSASTSAALTTWPAGRSEKSSFTPGRKNRSSGASSMLGAGVAPLSVVEWQCQALDRPAFAIGQVVLRQSREEHRDLLPRVFVGHVGDLRAHHRGVGDDIVGDRDRKVDELGHATQSATGLTLRQEGLRGTTGQLHKPQSVCVERSRDTRCRACLRGISSLVYSQRLQGRRRARCEREGERPERPKGEHMTDAAAVASHGAAYTPTKKDIRMVIAASSAGTIFEWYDFFIYGTLAAIIGKAFFPSDNATLEILLVWAEIGR